MKQMLVMYFITFLFLGNIYAQHTYYFSSKAAGEGKGTVQQPFTALQKLTQLTLQAGDTVFLKAGERFTANISLSNISGTKEHNIVFTSYGKGRCIIDGRNKEAFVISGSDHFQIRHLTLTGAGRKTGSTTDGLKLVNCKHVMVDDMDIAGYQKSGLLLYNCEKIVVSNVSAHENGFAGILVDGDYQKRISNNIHIINCKAYNNPGNPTALDNHSGNGILVGNCKNVLIEYCTATNNGWDMPRVGNGPVGIWAYEADSVIIQHCISYRNKTAKSAADGGGFDLDGGVSNSVIQYCLSYENWGSGYGIFQYKSAGKWYNNTIRYCISINDGNITDQASAMFIWNGLNGDSTFTDFNAYNNFFYNDKKYAFSFHQQSQHRKFSFFNNVFIAADTSNIYNGTDSSLNDTFIGNVWMNKSGGFKQNSFTDLATWAAATGYEQTNSKLEGTSFQHPLFDIPAKIDITNPHLLETNQVLLTLCNSALRNKGIDIRKMISINTDARDFFGHSIPLGQLFEPGVCEIR